MIRVLTGALCQGLESIKSFSCLSHLLDTGGFKILNVRLIILRAQWKSNIGGNGGWLHGGFCYVATIREWLLSPARQISPNSEPFKSNRLHLLTVQFFPPADRVVAVRVTVAQSVWLLIPAEYESRDIFCCHQPVTSKMKCHGKFCNPCQNHFSNSVFLLSATCWRSAPVIVTKRQHEDILALWPVFGSRDRTTIYGSSIPISAHCPVYVTLDLLGMLLSSGDKDFHYTFTTWA